MLILRFVLTAALCVSAASAEEAEFDPMSVDLMDALECRLDPPTYNGFALTTLSDKEMQRARGWHKVKGPNPFLEQFLLDTSIVVEGYRTNRIAFSSSGILAVIELADPAVLGRKTKIKSTFNAEEAISDMAKEAGVSRDVVAKEMPFRKYMGERVVKQWSLKDDELKMTFDYKVAHSISNVSSHPGKTLYGCVYTARMNENK